MHTSGELSVGHRDKYLLQSIALRQPYIGSRAPNSGYKTWIQSMRMDLFMTLINEGHSTYFWGHGLGGTIRRLVTPTNAYWLMDYGSLLSREEATVPAVGTLFNKLMTILLAGGWRFLSLSRKETSVPALEKILNKQMTTLKKYFLCYFKNYYNLSQKLRF